MFIHFFLQISCFPFHMWLRSLQLPYQTLNLILIHIIINIFKPNILLAFTFLKRALLCEIKILFFIIGNWNITISLGCCSRWFTNCWSFYLRLIFLSISITINGLLSIYFIIIIIKFLFIRYCLFRHFFNIFKKFFLFFFKSHYS